MRQSLQEEETGRSWQSLAVASWGLWPEGAPHAQRPRWLPCGFQGVGFIGKIILVTKGVRVMVSTDWPAPGQGSWPVHLVPTQPGVASSVFAAFLGLELKHS